MNDHKPPRRDVLDALEALQKSIERASQDVEFIRGRKANLIAICGTDRMEIDRVESELAAAEKGLVQLKTSAEELSHLVNQDDLSVL